MSPQQDATAPRRRPSAVAVAAPVAARIAVVLLVGALTAGCAVAAAPAGSPVVGTAPTGAPSGAPAGRSDPGWTSLSAGPARLFAEGSPVNTPVPAGAAVDPRSAAVTRHLTSEGGAVANLVEYAVPVLAVDGADADVPVSCNLSAEWGPCPFPSSGVPVPGDAPVADVVDNSLVLVDGDRSAEMWRVRRDGPGWSAAYGSVVDLTGAGWGATSTGAGASRLAGLVRLDELSAGEVRHALALTTDAPCAGEVRPPATKTDGDAGGDCVPEGARLQLDPAIDVDALPGLTRAEAVLAHALQTYGGYVVGRGDDPLAIAFERDLTAPASQPGRTYGESGLYGDYQRLPGIPWGSLRLLDG